MLYTEHHSDSQRMEREKYWWLQLRRCIKNIISEAEQFHIYFILAQAYLHAWQKVNITVLCCAVKPDSKKWSKTQWIMGDCVSKRERDKERDTERILLYRLIELAGRSPQSSYTSSLTYTWNLYHIASLNALIMHIWKVYKLWLMAVLIMNCWWKWALLKVAKLS